MTLGLKRARALMMEDSQAPRSAMSYEDLLAVSPQASIFTNRWWLDAVAPGSHEVLELRNPEGSLLAAWPVVYRDAFEGRYVVMPPLTQKLGILFAPADRSTCEDQSAKQKLAAQLVERIDGLSGFHQNFHETFTDWLPFYWRGYAQTTRYTYVLEDLSDLEAVWQGLRPNHRRDIRRAEKLGVTVEDDLPLAAFIDLNRKTFSRQGRDPLADEATIRRVDAACLANAGRRIFAGRGANGAVHAAVYVAWWRNTAYFLMAGSEPGLRDSGAQLLALWHAVRFASTVTRRFDFEGSMLPQVERVFRGFGATQTPYFAISRQPPPPSGLGGYVKAAIAFRLRPVRRLLKRSGNS